MHGRSPLIHSFLDISDFFLHSHYCRYKSVAEEYQQQPHVLAEPGSQGQRSDTTSLKEAMLKQQDLDSMLHGSPQWSEHSGQLTPRSVEAAPILPMDEVFHSSGDGQSLASGSVALPMGDGLGRGVPFMGTSLDQSLNSAIIDHAPLGSPLQSASFAGSDGGGGGGGGDSAMRGGVIGGVAPPTSIPMHLGMLAQSRLSHHSPGPQVSQSMNH